jgi:probable HAF family extracellular repeat protein
MRFAKNRKQLTRVITVAILGGSWAQSTRAAIPEYTILDLNTLGGGSSEANGLNNIGQVVGTSLTSSGATRAFLTSANAPINPATDMLPLLSGGTLNKAYGVNLSGQVSGWCSTAAGDRAYRYSRAVSSSLGTLGGDWSYGQAINNSGQVVGSSAIEHGPLSLTHAMLYSGGAMHDLGVLSPADNSYAYAINSNGSVVGFCSDPGGLTDRAFLWTPASANASTGSMSNLGDDLGGNYSYAYGMNDAGQIVGEATTSGDSVSHAFLRDVNGPMHDLGTLGGAFSKATAINGPGTIVGSSATTSAGTHAFIYADGTMVDLNDLIPLASNWTLGAATAVNDGGQIVGVGTISGTSRAFLLTAVPTWAVDGDGSWSGGPNWFGSVPSGTNAEAGLGGVITAPRTVTLDIARTIGRLVFNNTNGYTLVGPGTLTISGSMPDSGIEVRSGGHTISAAVKFASAATISLASASSLRLSGPITGAIRALRLGSDATLDLTNNNLLIDYAPADGTPIGTIASAIGAASNGGQWNGAGITSSTAASIAANSANTHKTALGYAEASALGLGSFSGQTVDPTTVLIRYTLSGDANLDGVVNALDFSALANNFGASGKLWNQGDFNYDGTVNALDFNSIATNYGAPLAASATSLTAVVPEPVLPLLLGITTFFCCRPSRTGGFDREVIARSRRSARSRQRKRAGENGFLLRKHASVALVR